LADVGPTLPLRSLTAAPASAQVCLFCWHKINETGKKQCPGCRQDYDEGKVQFTPVDPQK
jgi:hypothetical protein